MFFKAHNLTFEADPVAGERWRSVMKNDHGLTCRFDAKLSIQSSVIGWKLGQVDLVIADLAAQSLSPVSRGISTWPGDWIFLKLVTAGYVDFRSREKAWRFGAGSMFVVDPAYDYVEIFPERTKVTVLRIRKSSLRMRGAIHSAEEPLVGDLLSGDVAVTRDVIHSVATQCGGLSDVARDAIGNQLIELVQISIIDPSSGRSRRRGETLIYAARRYVSGHIADTDLNVEKVADAIHVSPQHLQRLFRSEGASVMQYIWQVRLQRAAMLLNMPDQRSRSIQETAWQCGFSTAAHFSRAFKKCYGQSPTDFKDSHVEFKNTSPLTTSNGAGNSGSGEENFALDELGIYEKIA